MAQETIREIIAVEKGIQAKITAEAEKIVQWLSEQEAEIAREFALEMEALRRAQDEEETRVRARIDERTTALLAEADRRASRCRELSRDELTAHLCRHLREILPGPNR